MNAFRLSRLPLTGPRLLAGFGTAALLAAVSLTASRPVHSAAGPIAVNVANVPLSTTAADNPDKQGVQYTVSITLSHGGIAAYNTSYIVPEGKRLVVEAIAASTDNFGDTNHHSVECGTQGGLNNSTAGTYFNILPDGSPFFTGHIQLHQYADAGTQVFLLVNRTETASDSSVIVSFTGYLVDMP